MESFFLVWNPEGNNPTHRHENRESAVNEAKRLASKNRGDKFYVLMSIGDATVDNVIWTEHDGDDSIPF